MHMIDDLVSTRCFNRGSTRFDPHEGAFNQYAIFKRGFGDWLVHDIQTTEHSILHEDHRCTVEKTGQTLGSDSTVDDDSMVFDDSVEPVLCGKLYWSRNIKMFL